jgi:hypothetical protein
MNLKCTLNDKASLWLLLIMKQGSAIVIGFCCLLWLGCAKPHGATVVSRYTFSNPLSIPITLDVYGNKEDYSHNSNRIATYTIDPGAKVNVPLTAAQTCWIDWYSADYSWNNWATGRLYKGSDDETPFPLPMLKVADVDDVLTIYAPARDTSRSIILNGGDTMSYWKMGVTDDTMLHGSYALVFRKGFEGTLSLKTSAGIVIENFSFETGRSYMLYKRGHFTLSLVNKQDNSNSGLIIWNPPGSRDSLMLVRENAGTPTGLGYYPLLRQ